MSVIWTPRGAYRTRDNSVLEMLTQYAKMYEDKLFVAQNIETGDYCLFRQNPDGQFPIFGWDHIPTEAELREELYRADRWKHGDAIMDRAYEKAKAMREESNKEAEEAAAEAAELIEFEVRSR